MLDDNGKKLGVWDEKTDSHDTRNNPQQGNVFKAHLHHDSFKIKTLKYGAGSGTKCCALSSDNKTHVLSISDCILSAAAAFAKKNKTWKFPGKYNCHSFQKWLLNQCCICKPGPFSKADVTYDKDTDDDNEAASTE